MLLCLDIGNTHIYGGVYHDEKFNLQFRYPSSSPCTSDQLGIFFKEVLRENDLDYKAIKEIAICSVVPALNYTIRAAFLKYFSLEPFFLTVDNAGLKISYPNPHEIGADRISNALATSVAYPNQNIIVMDLGTATTFDAINEEKSYLGGVIIPGIYIAMKSLYENTANLSAVHIIKPPKVLGHTTSANIQSGLYYSHLGAAREIINQISSHYFNGKTPVVIGTGGFAHLFEEDKIFTEIIPELVLQGLILAVKRNRKN